MLPLLIAYFLPILGLIFMLMVLLRGNDRERDDAVAFRNFLLVLIAWIGLLWTADLVNNSTTSLFLLRLAIAVGGFGPLFFFIFCERYVQTFNKITTALFTLLAVTFGFLSLTPYVIEEVQRGGLGVTIKTSSFLYNLQTLYGVLGYIIPLLWLRSKARRMNDPKRTDQVKLITMGIVIAVFIAALGGALIHTGGSNLLLPLALTLFAVTTFIGVFRHGLFDIRLVVARSLAYILVLGTLSAVFTTFAVVLTSIFSDQEVSTGLKITYSVMALLVALTYQPLKRVFDRASSRLFFRDYYDPQDVFDNLSDLLVRSVDTRQIERQSAKIIGDALKPLTLQYQLIAKNAEESKKPTLLGRMLEAKRDTLVSYELDDQKDLSLKQSMVEEEIAVAVRLKTSHADLGFMLLGHKRSGGVYSDQDLKVLGIAADEIAVGLQNALRFEEIQKFNITLQEKIKEATAELRVANTKLRKLDKTKDEFISMASHQLRTPLTAVKGYLSMILEGDAGKVSKTEEEYIQKAFSGAQKMVYLIADMLNVSRLQTGKFVIENQPTDLVELVQSEVDQLQAEAEQHQLKLIYHKPESLPKLNLDETKIRQVVMNFIDNAIYYTPSGGSITVDLDATDKEVIFTVTDTGVGVPANLQHHLFSKFYRADNARKIRPDGTGLGLFMAKKVITAQGGAIIFKSVEGKGSTFGFSFPRAAVEGRGETPQPVDTEKALAAAK